MRTAARKTWTAALRRSPRRLAGVVVCTALVFGAVASASLASHRPGGSHIRNVLHADRIGSVHFGEAPSRVIARLNRLLRHRPNEHYHLTKACNVDHAVAWPGLVTFFEHGRLVGYSYRPAYGAHRVPTLATAKGLRVGDTLRTGRRLYGPAFHQSAYNGGSWWATTPQGLVEGFVSGWPGGPRGSVATIAAGRVGCPATTP